MLFSALLAPIRMLFHTQYVVSALLGISVVWKSPPRDDTATPWSQAAIRHGGGTLLGLAWLGLVYWLNPHFLWWLLPVAGSLVIAIPRSEEHTSELQSLMRISYDVFCLKKKTTRKLHNT